MFYRKADGDRLASVSRAVQCLDDLDIDEYFDSVRFGFSISSDARGKVDQLRGKLITGLEGTHQGFSINGDGCPQAAYVFISGFNPHPPFGADDFVHSAIRSAETAGESGQETMRKTQDGAGRFVHFPKAPITSLSGHDSDFHRFAAEKIPRGIDAIDADVVERTATQLWHQPDVAGSNLLAKY